MIVLTSALAAAPVKLERVDLFSEEATDFWADDAPRLFIGTRGTAARFAEQITVGVAFPGASTVVGLSVARQSVRVRRPLSNRLPLLASGGVITHLGLPAGAAVGAEYWLGPVRIGVGVHAESSASWARPQWDHWRILPGLGLGVGVSPLAPGKW